MTDTPLAPGSTVGILGGGQLGRMLAMSAARLGLNCHIYCNEQRSPAFEVAADHTIGDYDDEAALKKFAKSVDVATLEFENVPAAALAAIAKDVPVFPPPYSVEVSQDRLAEKQFAEKLGIGVAPYCEVHSLEDLQDAVEQLGRPGLLKTRRLGYDGKGQVKITDSTGLPEAYESLSGAAALYEKFIDFDREISVVVVRGRDGETRFYDPSENRHENQILAETRIPARVPGTIAHAATDIAERIVSALDYCGVLCVELFYCGEHASAPLVVNEIAPRVHNSGHWTLDACAVSQFENHVRAVAGWPLGTCARHSDAIMRNLIGEDAENWLALAREENACLHLYGKRQIRPGRKMGHVTWLRELRRQD
ncbi:MAG: 5-(carboxyamino)imidazole ribonucleotide synthase [Hyphomicrobiaceae bacterium]|nr:5-(carboxyamino)imidazole ribonucleotide synthase [Hyphomicrobiaceae bacterium]